MTAYTLVIYATQCNASEVGREGRMDARPTQTRLAFMLEMCASGFIVTQFVLVGLLAILDRTD